MAVVTIEEQYLTDIANSIRQNNGATTTYTTAEMPAAIAGLTDYNNGEDTTQFEFDYLFGRLVNVSNSAITKLKPYAFSNQDNLVSVDLPNVLEIGGSSFSNCDNLTTINLSGATVIGELSFSNCSNLITITLPSVTEITSNYCFIDCPNLTTINLPNLTVINDISYAFNRLNSLRTLYLPSLTTIESNAWFRSSETGVTKFILPNLQTIGGLGDDSHTGIYATFVLPGSRIPTMTNLNLSTNRFGISYPQSVDYIYVPAAMVDAYCNSDWGAFYGSSKIRAIEDNPGVLEGYEV